MIRRDEADVENDWWALFFGAAETESGEKWVRKAPIRLAQMTPQSALSQNHLFFFGVKKRGLGAVPELFWSGGHVLCQSISIEYVLILKSR